LMAALLKNTGLTTRPRIHKRWTVSFQRGATVCKQFPTPEFSTKPEMASTTAPAPPVCGLCDQALAATVTATVQPCGHRFCGTVHAHGGVRAFGSTWGTMCGSWRLNIQNVFARPCPLSLPSARCLVDYIHVHAVTGAGKRCQSCAGPATEVSLEEHRAQVAPATACLRVAFKGVLFVVPPPVSGSILAHVARVFGMQPRTVKLLNK
jgi:hypothetical protein